jgi:hypothetical protein
LVISERGFFLGEEGAGLWVVVGVGGLFFAAGLEGGEILEGAVVHGVEALFGAGEAVEGAMGLIALEAGGEEEGGVDGRGAAGVFEEGADVGVEGRFGGGGVVVIVNPGEVGVVVVVVVVLLVLFGEVVFGAFELSFDVELGGVVEGGVGLLEALESPGEADGAVGEEEFGCGHGAKVGDGGYNARA